MPRLSLKIRLLAAIAMAAAPLLGLAQEEHSGHILGKVGEANFPISCNAAAQQQFNRAVAILHSFWYEEASKSFKDVAETDPGCAMAYWGEAMSLWYELWYPPSEAFLKAGMEASDKAKKISGKTERERAYIDAIGAFYQGWDKTDHRTRSLSYERAMEQVYLHYPEDREAAVFYALALNATALPSDKSYANEKKAGAILERVFAVEPDHPGVSHYLIHSYDYPSLAQAGLAAARHYAQIAPAVPHALHMPSHIFTRLGLWQDSISSNRNAAEVGQAYAAEEFGPGIVWDQSLHAMDYLEYAYLQSGEDRSARRVLDQLLAYPKAAPASLAAGFAIAAIPARYAVERRDWDMASSLSLPPVAFAWDRFPWTAAMITYARGLGAAHTGKLDEAEAELSKLQAVPDSLNLTKSSYWTDQVEVQRRSVAAALAQARGSDDEALTLMRSAADLEGASDKNNVTPGPIAPARELLGDMLIEMGQPALALTEYERSLGTDPGRYRAVAGAARAAAQVGDPVKARNYYLNLQQLCASADTVRPEQAEAKQYLATN